MQYYMHLLKLRSKYEKSNLHAYAQNFQINFWWFNGSWMQSEVPGASVGIVTQIYNKFGVSHE
jgi:hypothetical protein